MTRAEQRRQLREEGWRGKKSKRGATREQAETNVKTKSIERSRQNLKSMGISLP